MRNGLYRATVSALALMLALPGVAGAQETQTAQDDGTDAIIVTARRMEERLQDVPISITVFTQEDLAKRNIVNPTDLAAYTPSLSTNQRYGPEKGFFLLRGFTQEQSTAPSVGVYFADVVAPRGGGGTSSGNGAGAGDFFDLQNVQVLKGPQGTLFGRNTTGGAVLLTPQKPTGDLEGYVEGSAGNYGMWRAQGVINIPLAETFKVRFGVDRQKRRGYMINQSGIGPDDYNDVNYVAARLSIVADLTPDLENYTIARYSESKTNGYAARIIGCNAANPTGRAAVLAPLACAQIARQTDRGDGLLDAEVNNPNAAQRLRLWQATNTTTWQVSDTLIIKNIASYAEFRERASFALGSENFTINTASGPSKLMYATIAPVGNTDTSPQSTFVEELQFQGNLGDGRFLWQAGGYLEVSQALGWTQQYTANLLDCLDITAAQCRNTQGAGSLTAPQSRDFHNTKAIYAQGTYKLTDTLSLTGGLRYTMDRTRSVGQSTRIIFNAAGAQTSRVCVDTLRFRGPPAANGGPTPLVVTDPSQCLNTIRVKSEKPTWLVDLEYKPNEDLLLFAKYSRGYRQGGIFFNNVGIETWQPEKVDTFEVGAKATFRGALPGYVNVTGFYNNFSDQQIAATLVGKLNSGIAGALGILNAGKSRIWGLEAEGSVSPFDGLKVDLAYSYLNTELLELDFPTLPADSPFSDIRPNSAVNAPLSYAPKNKFTITGTYTLPLDEAIGRISVGATYAYTGSQYVSTPATSPFYRLPANEVVNLNLEWKAVLGQPIDAALFVTNLTDERYASSIAGQYGSAGFEIMQVAPPRMWGLRLRYSFGQ